MTHSKNKQTKKNTHEPNNMWGMQNKISLSYQN